MEEIQGRTMETLPCTRHENHCFYTSSHLFSQGWCVRFLNYYITNVQINSKDA